MTRVLVFSDEYPPAGGGAGTVAAQLTGDLVRAGADVYLLTGDEPRLPDPSAQQHIRVKRSRLTWPLTYRRVIGQTDLASFDLIVLNDFTAAYIAGLTFPASALARAVVVIHGEDARYVYVKKTMKHRLFAYRHVYTRLLQRCRRIVAVSSYAERIFSETSPVPIDAKLEHCYVGLPLGQMPLPRVLTKSELDVPSGSRLLFSASRLVEEKGLLNQLTLFNEAISDGAEYYWLVAGDGPLRSTLEQAIDRLGLAGRIRLLGRLPRSELAGYFKCADVFWLLSHATYETMGLVYLEAAFYGTPSIGLRNFGVTESIAESRSGFFYSGGPISPLVERCVAELTPEACTLHARTFSSDAFAARLLSHAA